jgi:hypothetical protein
LLQVAPQLIVPGELVMVPVPGPVVLTVRVKVGAGEKVAVTGTAEVPPVPEQPAPLQPANTDPPVGVAVRVIRVLVLKLAEQVAPQLMPAGELLTDPDPVPARVTLTGKAAGMKSALTDCAEFMVTEQAPVPGHAPLQPLNTEPAAGVGVRVTTEPLEKLAAQVVPQLIPAGVLTTDPVPAPDVVTVSVAGGRGAGPNVAVTLWLLDTAILQAPVPVHAPLQPVKTEPDAGTAARLTVEPELNVAEQVAPQFTPAGRLVTAPVPVPASVTETLNKGRNVAVTATFEFIGTVQLPRPAHGDPVQPAKTDPADGVAVMVTDVPESNAAEHVAPQLMPAGALVAEPDPAPARVTERLNWGVGGGPKFATTARFAFRVTVQEPVPAQAPLQPVNAEPAAGVAARVTTVPALNDVEQLVPQLIPAGVLVTVPVPVPDLLTFIVSVGTNVAETATSEVKVTVQEPVPEQAAPLQPANTDPGAATAVRAIAVPELKLALQVAPQLMPAGELVTVPEPAPFNAINRLN